MTIKEFADMYKYEIIVSRENLALTNRWDHSKNLEYYSAILANIDMGARWINHDELINYPLERLFDKSVFYKTAAYTKEHPEILRQLYYALGEELFNHSEIFTMENQKNNQCFLGAENYNNDPRNFYTPSKSSFSSSSSRSYSSSSSKYSGGYTERTIRGLMEYHGYSYEDAVEAEKYGIHPSVPSSCFD